jgi:hypothetical protein
VSEEKKLEKKNETAASEPVKVEKEKNKSGILPLVAVVLGCFLLVAVVLIFLNGQKLNKQVVDLKRQIVTLQTGEKEMGQRVLALEDEFVVMGIKHRLHKISKSRKNLTELKSVLADNPEVAAKVQALADDLEKEQERLAAEISGSGPRVFKGTRPLQPAGSRPPCFQGRCEPGKCFIAPAGHQPPCLRVTPVPVPAAAGHHPELSAPKTGNDKAKPQTGWSKFINMRIFGN